MNLKELKASMEKLSVDCIIQRYDFDDLEYDWEMVIENSVGDRIYIFKVDDGIAVIEERVYDEFTATVMLDTLRIANEADRLEIKNEIEKIERQTERQRKELENIKSLLI